MTFQGILNFANGLAETLCKDDLYAMEDRWEKEKLEAKKAIEKEFEGRREQLQKEVNALPKNDNLVAQTVISTPRGTVIKSHYKFK